MAEINYDITIDDTKQFVIELNEQGPQGARGYDGPPGADGIGINRIYKDSTSGLVDTYNIEYTNGNTTSFTVTNGNGISSIELTDTEDLTDTYTITFDNGDTTTFEVENGKGITSITGPVTVDNVDTYTINFNDGTSTTFDVANGIDGYSPTASVVKSGNKATITITDKNGTTTADIYDGTGSVTDVTVNGTSVLDGDVAKVIVPTNTNELTNGANFIPNTATQSTSLAILTSSTNDKNNTVALGYNSIAGGYMGIAIGSQASVTKTNGIQIGYGTNNEANSLYVSTSTSDNWKMLDSNGLIPDARLSSNIARTSNTLPSSTKYGADLSYSSNTLQLLDQDGNNLGNSVTIQSSPDIDNKSITTNSDGELQTVGVIDQNNTTNAIKTWTGTKVQYDNIATKDNTIMYYLTDTHAIYLGDTLVVNLANRNIGEIIPSALPLTDAGLHLLDGSLISGSGSYSAFVDYIADLYDSGDYTAIFETEANWQQAVSDYGVCGKFVYDSVNNTVRLPKITGIIECTTDVTALGDLVKAGLPNITGQYSTASDTSSIQSTSALSTGAFTVDNPTLSNASYSVGYTNGNGRIYDVGIDASLSSSIYGNSTTVQPQTIKVLYYIVIATSSKTDIQVDIDEIATDLNSKAGIDLTNINASQSAKDTIVSWGMPDYTAGVTISTPQAINLNYNALLIWYKEAGASSTTWAAVYKGTSTSGLKIALAGQSSSYGGGYYMLTLPLNKNEDYYIDLATAGTFSCKFYPLKGAN